LGGIQRGEKVGNIAQLVFHTRNKKEATPAVEAEPMFNF
jgi:hypothetical protein